MFDFELVSPERLLLSQKASMVTAPGAEGDFGVLSGHAPLIATLRAGVVTVQTSEENSTVRIFVSGGFAEITPERFTLLCEQALPLAEISAPALEAEQTELQKELQAGPGAERQREINSRLAHIGAILQSVRHDHG